MDNEILRLKNHDKDDKEFNVSHFDGTKKLEETKHKTSIASLIFEEADSLKTIYNHVEIATEKPKLFSTITIGLLLFVIDVIVGLFCYFTLKISLAIALIIICCATFPLLLTHFFYKLDTRSKYPFLTMFKLLTIGACVFFITETLFTTFSKYINTNNYLLTLLQSVLEISAIIAITSLFYKKNTKTGQITLMLIACTIASGFSFSKSLASTFDSLFVKVEIIGEPNETVGAIINSSNWAKTSIDNLIKNISFFGFYQPLMFISLCCIIGFSLNLYFENATIADKTKTSSLMMIILCIVINTLININTSVFLFHVIYNSCSIIFTAYMLYEVLDFSIKNEHYKE